MAQIRARPTDFGPHTTGQHMTTWHYRTSHPFAQILEAGHDYWVTISHLLKAGDEIIVEDAALNWRYMLSVRAVDQRNHIVAVEMMTVRDTVDGVLVFNQDAIDEKAQAAKADAEQAEKVAAERARLEADLDTARVKPTVYWRGPAVKWRVEAYGANIQGGFASKEEAQKALDDGSLAAKIDETRTIYMERELRKKKAA